MNLKKLLAIILSLLLVMSLFAACGDTDNDDPDPDSPSLDNIPAEVSELVDHLKENGISAEIKNFNTHDFYEFSPVFWTINTEYNTIVVYVFETNEQAEKNVSNFSPDGLGYSYELEDGSILESIVDIRWPNQTHLWHKGKTIIQYTSNDKIARILNAFYGEQFAGAEIPLLELETDEIKIASLKGPTTIGMVKLMNGSDNGHTSMKYDVSMFGTADEIVGLLVKGDIDIANVPCNLASVLYKRTESGIKVLDINTLGVLYVIETGEAVQSVEDLRGKTIYSTGKGTTPEYVLNYILESNGIDPTADVTVEYLSEATEVAAKLAESTDAIAVLPQPYVTVAMNQNESLRIALDLTDEWEKIDGTQLVTGVTIVRTEFLEANPNAVAQFMADYADSVEYVNANVDEAAALVGGYDIVAEGVAKKAIPYCNIVFQTGDEMKQNIEKYLTVLFNSDPSSVGGELPDENFYFLG